MFFWEIFTLLRFSPALLYATVLPLEQWKKKNYVSLIKFTNYYSSTFQGEGRGGQCLLVFSRKAKTRDFMPPPVFRSLLRPWIHLPFCSITSPYTHPSIHLIIHSNFHPLYSFSLILLYLIARDSTAYPGHQPELDPSHLKKEYNSFMTTSRAAFGDPGKMKWMNENLEIFKDLTCFSHWIWW